MAQFVVYFVPAVFQSISKGNRMISAWPIVKEVLLLEYDVRWVVVELMDVCESAHYEQ